MPVEQSILITAKSGYSRKFIEVCEFNYTYAKGDISSSEGNGRNLFTVQATSNKELKEIERRLKLAKWTEVETLNKNSENYRKKVIL